MGKYSVQFTLLSSNVGGSAQTQKFNWRLDPRCKTGGACPTRIETLYNGRTVGALAVFRNGDYQWATVHSVYTCGSGGTVDYKIGATLSYKLTPQREALVNDEWTVTRFDGTLSMNGDQGCGSSGPPKERYAITGTLLGRT